MRYYRMLMVGIMFVGLGICGSGTKNAEQVEVHEQKNNVNISEIETALTNWKVFLVGSEEADFGSDVYVTEQVRQLSDTALGLYKSMNADFQQNSLWDNDRKLTKSAHLTEQFEKLLILTRAYVTKGTVLYQQEKVLGDISNGIEFMLENPRYSGKYYFGNWWDWQIGVPQSLIPTLVLLADELDVGKLQSYADIIACYIPDPYQQMYGKSQDVQSALHFIPNHATSGANRTDIALSRLGIGLLQQDSAIIEEAVESIKDTFLIVSAGDGFYEDGSFIQHGDIPYTGSYGNVLVKGIAQILDIVEATCWQLDKSVLEEFVQQVQTAFLPLIVKGEMMPMVNGRSISRAPVATKKGFGSSTMFNLLLVAKFASQESKNHLMHAVKYWVSQNEDYYYQNIRNFNDLIMVRKLMKDSSIASDVVPYIGNKLYYSMDRFVNVQQGYTTGISMYSDKISSFESGNLENMRGWHTSDGMVYLFNEDSQFGERYWPTVDWYRLPGTTVDTVELEEERSSFVSQTSTAKQIGGTVSGEYAVVGMLLDKSGTRNNGKEVKMDLTGRKSWFILPNQIVALGMDINGTTQASIETIVENRLLDSDTIYQLLTSNGEDIYGTIGRKKLKENQWLLLSANQDGKNIGYYFPKETELTYETERRTGEYGLINQSFKNDIVYEADYQKLMINHGKKVEGAEYAYVILPNATVNSMQEYLSHPIQIIENSEKLQVIYDPESLIMMAMIWDENEKVRVGNIDIKQPSAVIIEPDDGKAKVTVTKLLPESQSIIDNLSEETQSLTNVTNDTSVYERVGRISLTMERQFGENFEFEYAR